MRPPLSEPVVAAAGAVSSSGRTAVIDASAVLVAVASSPPPAGTPATPLPPPEERASETGEPPSVEEAMTVETANRERGAGGLGPAWPWPVAVRVSSRRTCEAASALAAIEGRREPTAGVVVRPSAGVHGRTVNRWPRLSRQTAGPLPLPPAVLASPTRVTTRKSPPPAGSVVERPSARAEIAARCVGEKTADSWRPCASLSGDAIAALAAAATAATIEGDSP